MDFRLNNKFKSLLKNESGATLIEYGLIVALVAIASIIAITDFGVSVNDMFNFNKQAVEEVVNEAIK